MASYEFIFHNAPTIFTDPSGKFIFTLTGLLIGAAISGAITGIIAGIQNKNGKGFLSNFGLGFAAGFVGGAAIFGGAWAGTALLGASLGGTAAGAIGGGVGGFASSFSTAAITGSKWSWQGGLIALFAGALSGGVMGALAGKSLKGDGAAAGFNDANRSASTAPDYGGSSGVGYDLGSDLDWHSYDCILHACDVASPYGAPILY